MNQAELQLMAEERVLDAHTLMTGGRWTFAYYTVGYAIECALKSCVLSRMILTGRVFRDGKPESYWTHNFNTLIDLAGLKIELGQFSGLNSAFELNWGVTKDWKETSRYEQKSQADAELLYEAITNEPDGVLRWIRLHW